jgi:hypothetical protein
VSPATMKLAGREASTETRRRIGGQDWERVSRDLDARGSAVLEQLLSPEQCVALAELYPDDSVFRSRVIMARHGFGQGEYKYFSYPLPQNLADLRAGLYPELAPIANRWHGALGIDVRFPESTPSSVRRTDRETGFPHTVI